MDDRLDPKRPGPYDDLFLGRDMSTGRKLPRREHLWGVLASLAAFIIAVGALLFFSMAAGSRTKVTTNLSPAVMRTPPPPAFPGPDPVPARPAPER